MSSLATLLAVVSDLVVRAAPRKLSCEVGPDKRLREDLGFDSIGLMTLAFEIETAFDMDVADHAERYQQVVTVSDVARFVEAIGGACQPNLAGEPHGEVERPQTAG